MSFELLTNNCSYTKEITKGPRRKGNSYLEKYELMIKTRMQWRKWGNVGRRAIQLFLCITQMQPCGRWTPNTSVCPKNHKLRQGKTQKHWHTHRCCQDAQTELNSCRGTHTHTQGRTICPINNQGETSARISQNNHQDHTSLPSGLPSHHDPENSGVSTATRTHNTSVSWLHFHIRSMGIYRVWRFWAKPLD